MWIDAAENSDESLMEIDPLLERLKDCDFIEETTDIGNQPQDLRGA